MVIFIRKATENDYAFIDKLFCSIAAQHVKVYPHIFTDIAGKHYNKKYFFDMIAEKNGNLFVAEVDGECAGFVECYERVFEYREKPIMFISELAVLPKFRNLGVGTKLIEKVAELAKSHDCFSLELNVYNGNSAVEFYEKQGFTVQKLTLEKKI